MIFDQTPEGEWGAYVPDLPIIAGGADTREELEILMRKAIEFRIAELKAEGKPVLPPVTQALVIGVAA